MTRSLADGCSLARRTQWMDIRRSGFGMSEAVLFVVVFAGFFVLRGIAVTVFFFYLLPEGDRCPNCDAVTVRVQSTVWNRLLPGFRTSWCLACNWHGLLRHGPLTPAAPIAELTSKKE